MAPFTGCCLAAPAGRGAVRPAPAASRSPVLSGPAPRLAAPPAQRCPQAPRPRCRVARGRRGAPMGTRVSRRLCPGRVHTRVSRVPTATSVDVHVRPCSPSTRGASLHAAPSRPRGPRCRAPGCPRLPWEPCSSLPSVASPTPSFCTDPFPHRRLPSVPLHPVWVTPPSSPVWAPSLSSDLTAHSWPPPPSTWSRGQPAPPRLMALGLFQ